MLESMADIGSVGGEKDSNNVKKITSSAIEVLRELGR
jgi:hypothetical protein